MAWTVEEIEEMTEEEYNSLGQNQKQMVMQVLLDSLVSDGVAYQGDDGRYRLREDVRHIGDGMFVRRREN